MWQGVDWGEVVCRPVSENPPMTQAKLYLRHLLLTRSDWTQLPDVPSETKEAWAAYRQALRDITKQTGYPYEINWPTVPK